MESKKATPLSFPQLLNRREISQRELSRKMRTSEANVSRWLSGERGISLGTARKIAESLKADVTIPDVGDGFVFIPRGAKGRA